ncbi:MAG: hypothetical protein N3D10_03425 [Candidatus Micrarchaeota archaeon]|nr:hypothetical protein [Candidatus Micrarchaeota archaeon]
MQESKSTRSSFLRRMVLRGLWPDKSYSTSIKNYLSNKALLEQTIMEMDLNKRFLNYSNILKFALKKADIALSLSTLSQIKKDISDFGLEQLQEPIENSSLVVILKRIVSKDFDVELSKKVIDLLLLIKKDSLKGLYPARVSLHPIIKQYLKENVKKLKEEYTKTDSFLNK